MGNGSWFKIWGSWTSKNHHHSPVLPWFFPICPGLVQALGRLLNRNATRNAKLTNKNVKKRSFGRMPRGDDLFHKYLESFWPLESMSSESLKKTFRWCHWREIFNLSFQPLKGWLKVREKNKNKFLPLWACRTPVEENKFWFIAACLGKVGGAEWHFTALFGFVSVGGGPIWEPGKATAASKPQAASCYPLHTLPHLHHPEPPDLP